MYLEKVTLYGFKTFRTETELLLSPKVTCIVGPNGSGKSNIVDGIRWALGEHRLSFLRASSMEDLIFSGSAFKKPVSVASVKLTFNNEDRTFPVVNTPRVSIERRIYRSKESGYYLNGNPIRLQDVMKIFYSAGIFNHMYAIVSQGKVSEILLAKPEQKKNLIEQVAGVAVFKKQKREALKKLAETEQNLLRVKDLLNELRKRANKVISESKKAHIYYFLNDRLKQLESILFNYYLSRMSKEIVLLESGVKDIETEIKELEEKLVERENALTDLNDEKRKLEEEVDAVRRKRENLRVEEAKLSEKENRLEEQKELLEEKVAQANREIEKIDRTVQYVSEEYKKLLSEKTRIENLLQKEKEELAKVEKEFARINEEVAPIIAQEKENERKLSLLRDERLKKEKEISAIDSAISHTKEKITELKMLIQSAENMHIEDVGALKEMLASLQKEVEDLENKKEKMSQEVALARYKISELNSFIARYMPGKRKFKEGTLGSIVRVENIAEKIGEELENFVVEKTEDLKNKKNGGFFVKENLVKFRIKEDASIRPISVSSEFLQGIYEADTLKDAVKFFKENAESLFIKKIITRDGFVLFSPFEVKVNAGILINEKKKELNALVDRKNTLLKDISEISIQIKNKKAKIREVEERMRAAKEKLKKRSETLSKASLIDGMEKSLTEQRSKKSALESEVKRILSEIEKLQSASKQNELKEKANLLRKEIYNKKLRIKDIEYNLSRTNEELKRKENKKSGLQNRKALLEKDIKSAKEQLENVEKEILQNENALNKVKIDLSDAEKEEKSLREKLVSISEEVKRHTVEISRLTEQKENLFRKMEKQNVKLAEKKTKVQSIKEQMAEKGLKEKEVSYAVDERKIRIEIASVKAKINELGAIDFTSVGEEESIKEELEKKESVYKDVLSSKKELEKFIEELDKKAKEEFEKTLSGVEKYFSEFFRKMFKGGEASIERIFDEYDEVSGIEISVRLPGKRKQSLPLLSGGEKSLTALAFLFAIFKVKPAPFYVLDEVDAALDEENVVKFSELLSEESSFAQFIVITHNKETMQRADMLYGITMQEDGISKAVSLKLV